MGIPKENRSLGRPRLNCEDNANIQSGREISVINLTDDYLCYKGPKSPYNFFFLILIFNELLKFKTWDERQH